MLEIVGKCLEEIVLNAGFCAQAILSLLVVRSWRHV